MISRLDLAICDVPHPKKRGPHWGVWCLDLLQMRATALGPTETSVRARTESGYWFQVHHEPELGRLHDRQVARFLAFEDAADINANLTNLIYHARCIAHRAA